MTKKIIFFCGIISVSIVFLIISILVFITKGNTKLIKHKLKTGAVLITLLSAISIGITSCEPIVSCYLPIEKERNTEITVDESADGSIIMNLTENTVLKGIINYSKAENYSFQIFDNNNNVIQNQNIESSDGSFDEYKEEFIINIDCSLKNGQYKLNFYDTKIEEITESNKIIWQFLLIITN